MLVSSAYPQWLVHLFTPFSMHTCHFISVYLCPQDKSPGVELLGWGAGGLQRAAEVATLCPSACVPVGSWLTLTSERPGRAAPSLTLASRQASPQAGASGLALQAGTVCPWEQVVGRAASDLEESRHPAWTLEGAAQGAGRHRCRKRGRKVGCQDPSPHPYLDTWTCTCGRSG